MTNRDNRTGRYSFEGDMTRNRLEQHMKFNPVTFIGPGWSIEIDNGFNPDTFDNIELTHFLKKNEKYITGEQMLDRMGERKALNADAFLRLWEHKELIPKEWYNAATDGWIEFPGTVLCGSDGRRYCLYLHRHGGGSWFWNCDWLDYGRGRDNVSPLLASGTLPSATLDRPSDPLPLELDINGMKYSRV